ncbi:hypothetical protein ACA910_014932 [Epithemia clementina (nom. ined.)]
MLARVMNEYTGHDADVDLRFDLVEPLLEMGADLSFVNKGISKGVTGYDLDDQGSQKLYDKYTKGGYTPLHLLLAQGKESKLTQGFKNRR